MKRPLLPAKRDVTEGFLLETRPLRPVTQPRVSAVDELSGSLTALHETLREIDSLTNAFKGAVQQLKHRAVGAPAAKERAIEAEARPTCADPKGDTLPCGCRPLEVVVQEIWEIGADVSQVIYTAGTDAIVHAKGKVYCVTVTELQQ